MGNLTWCVNGTILSNGSEHYAGLYFIHESLKDKRTVM